MTPRPVARRPAAGRTLVAAVLAPVLLLAGCGGDAEETPKAEPSVNLPTSNVAVPDGVTLTEPGTTLAFGQPGVVAYEPNPQRGSVLSMSVDSVQTGRIVDFAAYDLKADTKASTPYYVRTTVKNVGNGDLGGTAVPLLAADSRNTLIQQSTFNNTFERCPSRPLPVPFAPNQTAQLCLVYLVPAGGTLSHMSYRPLQEFEPINWEGAIAPPVVPPKPKKKKG